MLKKQTILDRVEVTETGTIQVRHATYIIENGLRMTRPEYHRAAYSPGADVSTEDQRVQAIAALVWTPEVIAAYARLVCVGPSP